MGKLLKNSFFHDCYRDNIKVLFEYWIHIDIISLQYLFRLIMKLITLNLPEAYIDGLEKLVQDEIYPNRSEAIRLAVRDLIRKENAYNPIP